MTTSLQPWTVQIEIIDISGGDSPVAVAWVKNQTGDRIGYFKDARDAELVLETFKELEASKEQNEKLENQIQTLQDRIEELKDEMNTRV